MGFMLKHKEYGIYQGSCMGMGFWHPMSNMPEQGLCDFPTTEDAEDCRHFLCSSECDKPLVSDDLVILPFDFNLNEQLLHIGVER